MKIALCLSGNLRNAHTTIQSIRSFILHYDIDTYLLISSSEKEKDIQNIVNILSPCRLKMKIIDDLSDCANMNMWYKIQQCHLYASSQSNYDIFIRCRFDFYIEHFDKNIPFDKLNDNTLYIGMWKYDMFRIMSRYIPDEMFLGTKHIMNIYCNFYNVIQNSNNKCLKYIPPEADFSNFNKLNHHDIEYIDIKYQFKSYSDISLLTVMLTKFKNIGQFKMIFLYHIIVLLIFTFTIYLKFKS